MKSGRHEMDRWRPVGLRLMPKSSQSPNASVQWASGGRGQRDEEPM